jgi:hypothetical protein
MIHLTYRFILYNFINFLVIFITGLIYLYHLSILFIARTAR